MDKSNLLKDYILNIVKKENGRPIPEGILMHKLANAHRDELGYIKLDDLRASIRKLEAEKQISLTRGNSIVLKQKYSSDKNDKKFSRHSSYSDSNTELSTEVKKGWIHINASGNGFVSLNENDKAQWFVRKENINNAQNGDNVEFSVFLHKNERMTLENAVVKSVISHAKDTYVGEAVFTGGEKKIILDDKKSTLNIILDDYAGLVNGSKVLIRIERYEGNNAYASVLRIIGHKGDVGTDILSIVYDNGVEPDFSDAVLNEAKKITIDINEHERKIRVDLSNKPIVTIDPATSKDFDDAFYCEKLEDGKYLLSVQIADVTHYVKYQSELDKNAIERGCSIYLVDRVIPMVPHNLSDDICSLNPQVERLALSCDMIIDQNGSFSNIKVFPCIIKSHRRFSYDEVNKYISKETDFSKEEPEVKKSIDIGLELSDILSRMKNQRGYINFNVPKAVIKVNENGEPIEITKEIHGRAQKMIEDFAVAANEAVTIYANEKNYPFIYRVHDKPDEQKIKIFAIEAKKMNFKINTSLDNVESDTISKWLADNKDNPNIELINMFLLRSMAKAKYDTKNVGHFGLASKTYTHFTSPIRRYPDDIVHRIFWMWEFLKNDTSDETRKEFEKKLQELCEKASRCELRAIKCEREVDSMKFAEYMSKHIGEQFNGVITNLANFGFYVQLENTIEGFVSINSLGNDFYKYDETSNELIGSNTGQRFRFGMKVKVECINADKSSRKIEFKYIEQIKR